MSAAKMMFSMNADNIQHQTDSDLLSIRDAAYDLAQRLPRRRHTLLGSDPETAETREREALLAVSARAADILRRRDDKRFLAQNADSMADFG